MARTDLFIALTYNLETINNYANALLFVLRRVSFNTLLFSTYIST